MIGRAAAGVGVGVGSLRRGDVRNPHPLVHDPEAKGPNPLN